MPFAVFFLSSFCFVSLYFLIFRFRLVWRTLEILSFLFECDKICVFNGRFLCSFLPLSTDIITTRI